MELKYLITGTGRCGTVYMARCLTQWGIPCGHETIFSYDGIHGARRRLSGEREKRLSVASTMNWKPEGARGLDQWVDPETIVADSSYMAAPFLEDEIFQDAKIVHLVRNPSKVVHSFVNHIDYFQKHDQPNTYESFIFRSAPEIAASHLTAYERACLYYVVWNEMIEPHRDILVRVEDSLNELKLFLGVDVDTKDYGDKKVNTFKKPVADHFDVARIQDKEVLDRFVAIGERYGYNMTSKYLLI